METNQLYSTIHGGLNSTRTVDAWADPTAATVCQMCHAELLTALSWEVSAAFAAVQPALRDELLGLVEGDGVAVACHQVHDDELLFEC